MPTGHYVRTPAHGLAISAGLKAKIAASPDHKAAIVKNLVHDKASPRWKPANQVANSAAKKKWWAALTVEARASLLAARSAGQKVRWARLTADERSARMAPHREKATAAYVAKFNALSECERAARMEPAWRGRKTHVMSNEHRAAVSAAHKGKSLTPEVREKIASAKRNKPLSSEHRAAQSRGWSQLSHDARKERGRKCSVGLVKLAAHSTKEERTARSAPGRRAAQLASPSSLELAVASLLEALGVSFVRQHHIGSYTADFYIASRNCVVECDGAYWHSLPGVKEKDERRDAWMAARGYVVVRLPESDIVSGAASSILSRLAG